MVKIHCLQSNFHSICSLECSFDRKEIWGNIFADSKEVFGIVCRRHLMVYDIRWLRLRPTGHCTHEKLLELVLTDWRNLYNYVDPSSVKTLRLKSYCYKGYYKSSMQFQWTLRMTRHKPYMAEEQLIQNKIRWTFEQSGFKMVYLLSSCPFWSIFWVDNVGIDSDGVDQ